MTDYLSCAETAKLIRAQLKKNFPEQKFYVNSDVYSGGASIRINWIDGPTENQVKTIVHAFESADFDGSIDMKSYKDSYLLPDGSACRANVNGTADSLGWIPERHYTQPEGSKHVHFGSDFIFTNRHYSPAVRPLIKAVCDEHGVEEPKYYPGTMWVSGKPTGPETLSYDCNDPQFLNNHWLLEDIRKALDVDLSPVHKEPAPAPVQESIEITHERDWTWIKFSKKPNEQTLDLLKKVLNARWSHRRTAWYVCENVDETTVKVQLALA